jgi:hypothetical protein
MLAGNGFPTILFQFLMERIEKDGKQMKSLFGYQDTLEMVKNVVQEFQETQLMHKETFIRML